MTIDIYVDQHLFVHKKLLPSPLWRGTSPPTWRVCTRIWSALFGILKKRWKILNNGLLYRDISVCKKIFVTCCCLHNYLLNIMVLCRNDIRVGRGYRIGGDGLWLDCNTLIDESKTKRFLTIKFGQQRLLLAKHVRVF